MMTRLLVLCCVCISVFGFGCVSARVHRDQGDALLRRCELRNAIEEYDSVDLEELPVRERADLFLKRGIAQSKLGRADDAICSLSAAIAEEPMGGVDARALRAKLYLDRNEVTEAIIDLNEALARKQDHVEALNMRGRLYFLGGKYHEALRDFTKAIEAEGVSPRSGILRRNRAFVSIALGDFEAAKSDYVFYERWASQNELGLTDNDRCLLGIVHYAIGDSKLAFRYWGGVESRETRERIQSVLEASNEVPKDFCAKR